MVWGTADGPCEGVLPASVHVLQCVLSHQKCRTHTTRLSTNPAASTAHLKCQTSNLQEVLDVSRSSHSQLPGFKFGFESDVSAGAAGDAKVTVPHSKCLNEFNLEFKF